MFTADKQKKELTLHKGRLARDTTLFHINLTIDTSSSTDIPYRFNGRSRRNLPIGYATQRPSSFSYPGSAFTQRGLSVTVFKELLFLSSFLLYVVLFFVMIYIIPKKNILSTPF